MEKMRVKSDKPAFRPTFFAKKFRKEDDGILNIQQLFKKYFLYVY